MADLVTMGDLMTMFGLSRTRMYELTLRAGFPAPVAGTSRMRLWDRAAVETWADTNRPGWREKPS